MNETDTYKYLGILKCKQIQHTKIKKQLTTALTTTLQKILETHLNSKNSRKAMNKHIISSLTYSYGFTSCSQTHFKSLGHIIRTKMRKATMYHKHPSSERFLLPKKNGSARIIEMHNLHNSKVKSLRTYFHNKKKTSHPHQILSDTYVNYTPLNFHDPLLQQNDNIRMMHERITWTSKTRHERHAYDLETCG
jgi:hypothetical protein